MTKIFRLRRLQARTVIRKFVLNKTSIEIGINIDQVTRLEDEGDKKFAEPFDNLMQTLAKVLLKHSTSR